MLSAAVSLAPRNSQPISIKPITAPMSSASDEARQIERPDAGEGVGQGAGDRDGRIGERRRGREPVGGGDVEPDQPRHRGALTAHAAEDRRDQAERRDALRRTIARRRCALSVESSNSGSSNISMRDHGRRRCRPRSARRCRAPPRRGGSSRCSAKTSVTAGLKCAPEIGPNIGDQHHEDRAGRHRVAEQRQRDVLRQASRAMMPEPTTVATSKAVPSASAARRRGKIACGHQPAFGAAIVAPSMRPISRSFVPSASRVDAAQAAGW